MMNLLKLTTHVSFTIDWAVVLKSTLLIGVGLLIGLILVAVMFERKDF